MQISDLIKPIKVGIRSKLFICAGAIITGLTYCYVDSPLFRLAALLVFFILVEAMVVVWFPSFFQIWYENTKLIFAKKGFVKEYQNAKLTQLANDLKVKLNKKRPLGVRQGLNNAYSNYFTSRIVFGDILLRKLNKNEQLALAVHELTHLKKSHPFNLIFWTALVSTILYYIALFASPPPIVSQLIYVASFIITFVFVSWRNEYSADANAAKTVGVNHIISLLKKLAPPKQRDKESITHPSIKDRINRLQKIQY